MRLIHFKKTKGTKTEVEIPTTSALAPQNIATYTVEKDGKLTHTAVGWLLPVKPGSDSYEGHRFELVITPEEIAHVRAFLDEAEKRFAENKVPGKGEETITTTDVKE